MSRMFKYTVDPLLPYILMPMEAVVRHVGMQGRSLRVWAEVPPGAVDVARGFGIIATGGDVPAAGAYVGTFMDGMFVWHLYEVPS